LFIEGDDVQVRALLPGQLWDGTMVAMPGRRVDLPSVPELTDSERRLLPLLTTPLSLRDAAQLLEMPRDEVVAHAKSIYAKLGVAADSERGRFA
jgi:ATP/maltotriose-dependent transcriptional regulator MalT